MFQKRFFSIFSLLLILIMLCLISACGSSRGSDSSGNGGKKSPIIETWEKTFGGTGVDEGTAVLESSDGGFIIVGNTNSTGFGGQDVYLVKTDAKGNELFNKTFGGINNDIGSDIQETSDGGYIITGRTDSFGAGYYDAYLIRADSGGNELWSSALGGSGVDACYAVDETWDNGFVIAGMSYTYGDLNLSDFYLLKTDGSGNMKWAKTYGGSNCDQSYSMQETSDKGFIIVGTTNCGGVNSDIYLVKTDLDGNELWSKTYGGVDFESGKFVQQTTDGGYIILGTTKSYGVGGNDIYLIKTGSSGNELWSKTFGGADFDIGSQVRQTSDGGYIVVGSTRSFGNANGKDDVYLVKTDSSGNEVWSNTFGGSDYDEGYSVQETTDGGFIIVGDTMSYGAGSWDVYLIKTDANGKVQ